MNIRFSRSPEEEALIASILPKEPLTDTILIPGLMKVAKKILVTTLRNELEIYRAYPKAGPMNKLEFNPTNHKTCFMGQGFRVSNNTMGDGHLSEYRRAVGTLNHAKWGNATLLEIWAADHYDSHRDMVKGAFSYGKGDRNTCPILKFEVFPLFANKKSGKKTLDDDDKELFRERYLVEVNGFLASYDRKPIKKLDKGWLEDFEKAWEREKLSLF